MILRLKEIDQQEKILESSKKKKKRHIRFKLAL